MRIYYTPKFEREYKKLPPEIRVEVRKREKIFRENPRDHRLRTHKLKGNWEDFWSFSVTPSHRIIFEFIDAKTVHFHSIGDHSVYQ